MITPSSEIVSAANVAAIAVLVGTSVREEDLDLVFEVNAARRVSAVSVADIAALLRDRPPTSPAAGWVARKDALVAAIEAEQVTS